MYRFLNFCDIIFYIMIRRTFMEFIEIKKKLENSNKRIEELWRLL